MCITRLCCATHVWFKDPYWPAVHRLVFNQSEHCNACNCQSYQSPVKSFPVTSRLRGAVIPMHPAPCRGRVRALVCAVFSDGVLLSERLLLTPVISLGECERWPLRFYALSRFSFPVIYPSTKLRFCDCLAGFIWQLFGGVLWFNFPFTLYSRNAGEPPVQ